VGFSKPVVVAIEADKVSPRCAVPEMVGLAEPNCGLFLTLSEVAVKAIADPALALLLRTFTVTRARRYLPAKSSVGLIELAVALATCTQSLGKAFGACDCSEVQANQP
jgi:hypothetical protein